MTSLWHLVGLVLAMSLTTGPRRRERIAGTENPADMLTKHVEGGVINKHSAAIMIEFHEGRVTTAPKLAGGG